MKTRVCLIAAALLGAVVGARGEGIDYFSLSLEELMQIPIVESSSRQPEPWNMTTIPVSVIRADEIHYSGLTSLGEILQFAPGVEYIKLGNNDEMIGVRGFLDTYADKTLLMIDGRPAENHVWGGFELRRLPVLLEDIERVEIVRGPASAAWGANAVNGVINIITKEPKDALGFASSVTLDESGNSYSVARWGEQDGNLSYRLSVGYSEAEVSGGDTQLTGIALPSTPQNRDFYRDSVFDSLFVYEPADATKISFGLSHSRREEGAGYFIGYQPDADSELETSRAFLRLDQELDERQSFSLEWAGRLEQSRYPSVIHVDAEENDVELEYTREDGRNSLTVGANTRFTRIKSEPDNPDNYIDLVKSPYSEEWFGLFAVDRWQVRDRLVLEGQVRGDRYSETEDDWSGRLSALLSLDEEDRHVIRLSTARAFRAPMAVYRDTLLRRSFIPVPVNIPGGDIRNEHVTAYELGYTALLSSNYTARVNAYYNQYRDMVLVNLVAAPSLVPQQFESGGSASAHGVELELEAKSSIGRIAVWGAWQNYKSDYVARYKEPSPLLAGLSGRLYLPARTVLNVNYKYFHKSPVQYRGGGMAIPWFRTTQRLDVTLSKRFVDDRAELMIGVSDLFDETKDPYLSPSAYTPVYDTPGRTFFVRAGVNF